MKWLPGKDRDGGVQLCGDGHPAYFVSACGKYTVSRALTVLGTRYDGWLRRVDGRGRTELPIQLVGGVDSAAIAAKACVEHANGNHP